MEPGFFLAWIQVLLISILSHMNPIHILTPYILNIHFNIIFPSTLGSGKWSVSFGFWTAFLHVFLIPPCDILSSDLSLVDFITLIISVGSANYEAPHYVTFSSLLFVSQTHQLLYSDLMPGFVCVHTFVYCSFYTLHTRLEGKILSALVEPSCENAACSSVLPCRRFRIIYDSFGRSWTAGN